MYCDIISFTLWLKAITVLALLSPSQGQFGLHSKFSRFELLTSRHITVRVRRDQGELTKHKRVTLSIFGRKISLSLTPGLPDSVRNTDNFYAFYKNGTKSKIYLDPNDFHEGVIKGHPGSRVSSFHHKGLWAIQAFHPTMSFSVEPLSFYPGYKNTQQMVAFRHRDIETENSTGKIFCKHLRHHRNSSLNLSDYIISNIWKRHGIRNTHLSKYNKRMTRKVHDNKRRNNDGRVVKRNNSDIHSGEHRNRRSTQPHLVCDLMSIADNKLVDGIGGGSVIKTAKLLVHVYAVANDIFTSTPFDVPHKIGIRIRAMHVYKHPVAEIDPTKNDDPSACVKWLIGNMTVVRHYKQYCLVHLSTQRFFEKGILGAALTPEKVERESSMGICGSSNDRMYSMNIGVSSVMSRLRLVSYTEYTLVVTHELGHSFGAAHDESRECAPKEEDGGTYLMWFHTGKGLNPNNRKFSNCSIRDISKVLKKRTNCLVRTYKNLENVCGDGNLDFGEDCDSGLLGNNNVSECCTSKCRFGQNATCSPFNHPCCKDCAVASNTEPCYLGLDNEVGCFEQAFCDGMQYHTCPTSRAKPDGASCRSTGECQHGMCIGPCSLISQKENLEVVYEECTCTKVKEEMCTVCCRELGKKDCKSYGIPLKEGSPCSLGYCKNGSCMAEVNSIFWKGESTSQKKPTTISAFQVFGLVSLGVVIVGLMAFFMWMMVQLSDIAD